MPYSLGEIASRIGAELHGDPSCVITGVAPLASAGAGQITFLGNRKLASLLPRTRASAVILAASDLASCPVHALVAKEPYVAYVRAAQLLHPEPEFTPGVHALASVAASASLGAGVAVGPCAVVGERVRLGDNVYVGPGCVIGDDVEIGRDSRLIANVTICNGVSIGQRVRLHPGVVIGADGFGLAREEGGRWLKIPQLGRVIIHDDVEIGANSAVDRGAIGDTVIEEGVKIDNLVQIGHNTVVGAHTAIAGCAVIAGSVRIGKRCMIGGAVAIAGHIDITDDVVITGMSGVPNSIRSPGTYSSGMPVTDNRTWLRNTVRLRHLDEIARKVGFLEAELRRLREQQEGRGPEGDE
jgi:UDP-3-O-[3-hydroxymyristoyl] glucosamine N-acyltransferase